MAMQIEDLDPNQPLLTRKIGHPYIIGVFDRTDPGGGLVLAKEADTKERAFELMRWCLVLFDNFWIMEEPQGPGQTWTNVWEQDATSMANPEHIRKPRCYRSKVRCTTRT